MNLLKINGITMFNVSLLICALFNYCDGDINRSIKRHEAMIKTLAVTVTVTGGDVAHKSIKQHPIL